MTKRFGILITAVLAFAIAPAVALAGQSDEAAAKKADRIAALQAKVDDFVECLAGDPHGIAIDPPISVEAIKNAHTVAHRGRHGIRHRFRRHRDQANRTARFVVRHGELDRSDPDTRTAVKACRDALRTDLATERQEDVDALATCLNKNHVVTAVQLSERPRLASKRGFLRRAAFVMLRQSDSSLRDAGVRADARACIKEVRNPDSA